MYCNVTPVTKIEFEKDTDMMHIIMHTDIYVVDVQDMKDGSNCSILMHGHVALTFANILHVACTPSPL